MASIERFVHITNAFDREATRTPGEAFDMVSALFGRAVQPTAVREAIVKSILEATTARELDPVGLREVDWPQ